MPSPFVQKHAPSTQGQTPPPAAPASAPALTDLAGLQNHLADLNVQLAGYQGQMTAVQRQLRNKALDPASRSQLFLKTTQLSTQLAQTEGDIAAIRMQIAQQQGVSASQVSNTGQIVVPPPYNPPPYTPRRNADPDMVVGLSFALAMVIGFPLAVGYARRMWRGKPAAAPAPTNDIAPRLDRLEQAVDTIAIEIERISEGQRFVTKILAERPAVAAAAMHANDAARGEEKSILALGAGPIEPIRVSEKQAVRQQTSTTPH
jgi:hypothetical protein